MNNDFGNLILSRKIEEDLVITVPPSNAEITIVVKVKKTTVKSSVISIQAPRKVRVLRGEVHRSIKEEEVSKSPKE